MQVDYVIQKSKRRSICIQIGDDRKVIVKAPFGTTVEAVENFLREKRSWILKHIQKMEQQNQLASEMGFLTDEDLKKIKKEAKEIIPRKVEKFAKLLGVSYNRIFIRLQKSRWGSCSADGNLNFNCLLVLMPDEILESVVVHELCHRKHMNHSKAFYEEVLRIFPEYKRCDRWLKQNGGAYFRRISTLQGL